MYNIYFRITVIGILILKVGYYFFNVIVFPIVLVQENEKGNNLILYSTLTALTAYLNLTAQLLLLLSVENSLDKLAMQWRGKYCAKVRRMWWLYEGGCAVLSHSTCLLLQSRFLKVIFYRQQQQYNNAEKGGHFAGQTTCTHNIADSEHDVLTCMLYVQQHFHLLKPAFFLFCPKLYGDFKAEYPVLYSRKKKS